MGEQFAEENNAKEKLIKENSQMLEAKKEIDSELILLRQHHKEASQEIEQLKSKAEESENLQIDLNKVKSELKASSEENRGLKLKIKQFESMTDLSELKQENAILSERVSQYEE